MIHRCDRTGAVRGPCAQDESHVIQAQSVVDVTAGLKVPAMNRVEGATEYPDYAQAPAPFKAP
jgi:hypothetical protein